MSASSHHLMYLLSCMSKTFELFPWTLHSQKILQNLSGCHFPKNTVFRSQNDSLVVGWVSPCADVSQKSQNRIVWFSGDTPISSTTLNRLVSTTMVGKVTKIKISNTNSNYKSFSLHISLEASGTKSTENLQNVIRLQQTVTLTSSKAADSLFPTSVTGSGVI